MFGNVSKYFSVDNMKKTGLYGLVYDFSADCHSINVDDILDIHKYLMKIHKLMFRLVNKYLLHY